MKANKALATYLNNHLAASVGALELLTSLKAAQENSDLAQFAADLHDEIEAEQQEVANLMERLDVTQNKPNQAVGWLAEKFTQIKLHFDDADDGTMHLLESLELIMVGIEGKRGLWSAMAAAAIPGLPISEYERYARQSEDQQRRVETMRLAAAKSLFGVE